MIRQTQITKTRVTKTKITATQSLETLKSKCFQYAFELSADAAVGMRKLHATERNIETTELALGFSISVVFDFAMMLCSRMTGTIIHLY